MLQQRHYIRLLQDYHLRYDLCLRHSQLPMLTVPTLLCYQHNVSVQDNQHRIAAWREPARSKLTNLAVPRQV